MKTIKIILVMVITYSLYNLPANAQSAHDSISDKRGKFDFGVKLNGGASYINYFNIINNTVYKNYVEPSWQGGLFFNLYIHHKFTLGAELLFTDINSREYIGTLYTNQSATPPQGLKGKENLWIYDYDLSIPIYIGYNFNRLNVNFGFQYNYSIAGKSENKGQASYNGSTIYWDNKDHSFSIYGGDFGTRIGLTYKVSDKFSIDANYYFGATSLINNNPELLKPWNYETQQCTVGLRYNFISKEKLPDDKDDNCGQFDVGLKANGGVSYIKTKYQDAYQSSLFGGNINDKDYVRPSAQGGLFFNIHLPHKFTFGWELLYVQINGKENLVLQETNQYGNPTGQYIKDIIWRHISYFGLPIYIGYNYKKFNINFGFQFNAALTSSETDNGQELNYTNVQNTLNNNNKLGISEYDYGIRVGLIYKLSNRFALEANYYDGRTNIIRNNDIGAFVIWEVQQMTVGLRFKLGSSSGHNGKKN